MTNLVQVYRIELLAGDTMEHTTLIVEENDLHWLEFFCKLSGSNVCVDVQDLAGVGFCETGEDREGAGTDGGLDRTLVDFGDLSDETVLVLVEVVGSEDARGDGTGTGAKFLEGGHEFEVLIEEDAASDLKGLCV